MKLQLIDVSPSIMAELVALEKVAVKNPDKLPFGEYTELESVLYFDGVPLRFLKKGNDIYFWDYAEEVGGLEEIASLTKIEGIGVGTTDYLAAEISKQKRRRKKLLQACEQICKGRAMHINARIQMQQVAQNEKVRAKIEKAAVRIMAESPNTAKIKVTRPMVKSRRVVRRIKVDQGIHNLYTSEDEIEQEVELSSDTPTACHLSIEERNNIVEKTSEKHFENYKKQSIIKDTLKTKVTKGEKQNAKSNSEGIEKS